MFQFMCSFSLLQIYASLSAIRGRCIGPDMHDLLTRAIFGMSQGASVNYV